MASEKKHWFVYVIQSEADYSLYTGISTNPVKRLKAHNSGKGAKRTRGRGPWRLLAVEEKPNKVRALELEYQLKHSTREMKLAWSAKHRSVDGSWRGPTGREGAAGPQPYDKEAGGHPRE